MSRERVLAVAARVEASWDALAADPAVVIDADAVEQAIGMLDRGDVRVAEPDGQGEWLVHAWAKQAVLLYFRMRGLEVTGAGPFEYHDKLPLKHGYDELGVRVVPRRPLLRPCLSPGVVLMPSYVNIGAWVGPRTLVDTWATVGSCAQIGSDVHLSGGVGIGGVLEPLQAAPVVIEDGSFIGSRCIVVEGVRVEARAVLGAGVVLTGNTPVIDVTGPEPVEHRGRVPSGAVVIGESPREFRQATSGFLAADHRHRTAETDDKVQLNEMLRDFGSSMG